MYVDAQLTKEIKQAKLYWENISGRREEMNILNDILPQSISYYEKKSFIPRVRFYKNFSYIN